MTKEEMIQKYQLKIQNGELITCLADTLKDGLEKYGFQWANNVANRIYKEIIEDLGELQ